MRKMERSAGSSHPDLMQTRRDEAIAFFHVNQAARNAAERVVALFFTVTAIAGSIGVAAHNPDAVLPLPALLLLLVSYMFQQYADLTVIGTTRRRLEDLVNHEIGGDGLVYESTVAPIRKTPPLSHSMRFLQGLIFLIGIAATAAGAIVAIRDHNALILIGFSLATFLAAISCLYSYVHMQKSGDATTEKLAEDGLGDRCGVLLPVNLYREARDTASHGETESETFERLLQAALSREESVSP
jgi:hypothetical protein